MHSDVRMITIRGGEAGGPGASLAERTRHELEPALAAVRRGSALLLVIDVERNAWDWQWDGTRLSSRRIAADHHDLVVRLLSATVPVVVRLDGTVSGLGLALALACDLRFVTDGARVRVGPAASAAAVVTGLPWLLRDRLGSSRAMELMLTGRELDAAQARTVGLACDGSFEDAVQALGSAPPAVTSALVRSLSGPAVTACSEHLAYEAWLGELATSGGDRA